MEYISRLATKPAVAPSPETLFIDGCLALCDHALYKTLNKDCDWLHKRYDVLQSYIIYYL